MPERQCPQCGSPLDANAPEGLCPACLLKRGLEPNTAGYTFEPAHSLRWTPPTPEELAALFPELDILELIGRGGMGAVYKARQKSLDRLVALKILPPEISRDPAFAERLAREAQALARLNHPHIVTIHDFGQRQAPPTPEQPSSEQITGLPTPQASSFRGLRPQALFFFLMEYIDGLSLRQLLDTGRMAPPEALAIVPQICEALQYAHDRGIVHRDIKPENILLSRQGQVKIADFGLAKLVGRAGTPDQAAPASGISDQSEISNLKSEISHAQIMGTPNYMAPEQAERPGEVDHRADIYSLGVVFYQMLTGELPLGSFEPPSRRVHIDVRLDEVVLRALEREPQRRYQQASEVKTQVETIVQTASGAPGSGLPPKAAAHREGPATLGQPEFNKWGVIAESVPYLALTVGVFLLLAWSLSKLGLVSQPVLQALPIVLFVVVFVLGRLFISRRRAQTSPGAGGATGGLSTSASTFGSNTGRQAATPGSGTPQSTPPWQPMRLSKLAVVGACWAPFALLAFLGMFAVQVAVTVPEGSPPPGPAWWQILAMLTILPLGLTAPFGTTICGLIATMQIRRSNDRLYGLPLALFDALLFPLLVLDIVIFIVLGRGGGGVAKELINAKGLYGTVWDNLAPWVVILLVAIIIGVVDFLIVRTAWRAANRPLRNRDVGPATSPPAVGGQANSRGTSGGAAPTRSPLGVIALILSLAACLLPLLLSLAIAAGFGFAWKLVVLACGGFFVLEATAFVLGVVAWRSAPGKAAVAIALGMVLCISPMGAILAPFLSHMQHTSRVEATMRDGEQLESANQTLRSLLSQGITYQLKNDFIARGLRYDTLRVDLDPDGRHATVVLHGLRERRSVDGRDVWTPVEGSLGANHEQDDMWRVTGSGALGFVDFPLPAAAPADSAELTPTPGVAIAQPLASSSSQPASTDATFGPVIELTLPDYSTVQPGGLDLDRGAFRVYPYNEDRESFDQVADWIRSAGVDLAFESHSEVKGVEGVELAAIKVPKEAWDWPADRVRQALRSVSNPRIADGPNRNRASVRQAMVVLCTTSQAPSTYLIRTREGSVGVLEIVAFVGQQPTAVKVRCKFLSDVWKPNPRAAVNMAPRFYLDRDTTVRGHAIVVEDGATTRYVLYCGDFFPTYSTSKTGQNIWSGQAAIRLPGGKTIDLLHDWDNPNSVSLNKQQYDLRQGRVLVLQKDGIVRQLPLHPGPVNFKTLPELAEQITAGLAAPPAATQAAIFPVALDSTPVLPQRAATPSVESHSSGVFLGLRNLVVLAVLLALLAGGVLAVVLIVRAMRPVAGPAPAAAEPPLAGSRPSDPYSAIARQRKTNGRSTMPVGGLLLTVALHVLVGLVVLGCFVFVVPRFVKVFDDFNLALPWATLTVIRLARLLQATWFLVASLALAGDVGVCLLAQRLGGNRLRNVWSLIVVLGLGSILVLSAIALWLPQRELAASVSPAAGASRWAHSTAHYGKDGHSAFVVYDPARTHYVLYYHGDFDSASSGWHNNQGPTWQDSGTIRLLPSGQTFGVRRDSASPDSLSLNEQKYDLRKGRVFVLQDDGSVQHRSVQPGLVTKENLPELAQRIASAPAEPAPASERRHLESDRRELQAELAQHRELGRTDVHPLVKRTRERLQAIEQRMATLNLAGDAPPAVAVMGIPHGTVTRVVTDGQKATIEARLNNAIGAVRVFIGNEKLGWSFGEGKAGAVTGTVEASEQIPLEGGTLGKGFVIRWGGGSLANVTITPGGPVPFGTLVFRDNAAIVNRDGVWTFADIRKPDGELVPVSVRVWATLPPAEAPAASPSGGF